MDILQYFHKNETPIFNIGDQVRLKKYPEDVRQLYNREYPNCYLSKEKFKEVFDNIAKQIGDRNHIVIGIKTGTPAAGGWWVEIDNKSVWFHANLFEIC